MRKLVSAEYVHHYKKNLSFAFPVIISQMGHVMVYLADSIMIGRTGTTALAACSLGNAVFTVFLVFGMGYSYGITPLIAQENGKKNYKQCGILLEHGLFANLCIGVLLFAMIYVFAQLLPQLGQAPDVAAQAMPFLKIIGFSMIPLMIFLSFKQFAEGLSFTKQSMYISITANILNVILNYILIYGHWGFPALGLKGAGYANFMARAFMAVCMMILVIRSPLFEKYRKEFHIRNIQKSILIKISKIGVPVALQFVFEVSAFTGAAIIIGWIGTAELAAHQIALSLAAMTYMAASGISSAATVRVGHEYGRRYFSDLRIAGFSSFVLVILFMGSCALGFILLRNILPGFYVQDPEVIRIAASLLLIAAFFQLSDGVQVVGLGSLRGMSDVKIPTLITLLAYWIIGLPLGYILGFKLQLGVQGVWYGLLTGLSVAAVLLFSRFYYFSKKQIMQG